MLQNEHALEIGIDLLLSVKPGDTYQNKHALHHQIIYCYWWLQDTQKDLKKTKPQGISNQEVCLH